ncbi:MAG: cache domain-containing protein [Deltaproteobacteria bacterium]|nr:cache domain-containing protein [Deltaproteobacteria bacterium]
MLNRIKLSTRILLLCISVIIGFSLIFAWIIPQVRTSLYDAKYEKTRQLVETAWGVLDYYAKQAKASALPLDEAQKRAKEAVKTLRYNKEDYFWINDLEPRMVMHPYKPELDGKNLSEEKDPNGKRLFVAFVDVCKKEGKGFVDYFWPKPGVSTPVPKISYVKALPEWGWIIGSGIYLDDVQAEVSRILYILIGVMAGITFGGLIFSYLMGKSISRPIYRVIDGLTDGADQVASASSQVASSSQSLAEGASEQAAGLEETSSSIEEMASMTKHNAENARQADSLMAGTSRVVDEANHSMAELTGSMKAISAASEETAKIIKTIDEIAFQTNLLALNAAVEAARAGEAGAGFAVVADEVRNLAMRAAEAAKNTANLIEGSVKKIKTGSDIVSKTNEAFTKVATGSKKVGDLVGEITAASQEQAQGIDQINKAVAEMDKVIQMNAASAEESASASEEMNAQAEQMKAFVKELAAVVNGSQNGAIGHQTKILSHHETVKGKIFRGSLKKPKEVNPEQIIPMGEGDFKEF